MKNYKEKQKEKFIIAMQWALGVYGVQESIENLNKNLKTSRRLQDYGKMSFPMFRYAQQTVMGVEELTKECVRLAGLYLTGEPFTYTRDSCIYFVACNVEGEE